MELSRHWWKRSPARRGKRSMEGRRWRGGLEGLETRALLSGITEYSLLPAENNNAASEPLNVTAGPDGNVWFTDMGTNAIGKITPSGQITIYTAGLTAGSKPQGIVAGPDGNLWFAETQANKIGKINPSTGQITEYSAGLSANAQPVNITVGPDGNLWFTEFGANAIGKISPTTGQITQYSSGMTSGAGPWAITTAGGNLWFTEQSVGKIGKINPSTGQITSYSQGLASNSFPTGIATGSDGNVWFTEYYSSKIGKVAPSTGQITQIPISLPGNPGADLPDITAGPDGNLWFTALGTSQIGAINPTTQAISVLNPTTNSSPMGIAAGPDGNVWFTEVNLPNSASGQTLQGGAIGVAQLSTQLAVTAQPPASIAAGAAFGLTVEVTYANGAVDRNFSGNVTVALAANPGGGVLGGTTTVPVANGVATFSDLTLSTAGNGYALQVSSNGPSSSTTAAFNVAPPSPSPTPPPPTPTSTPPSTTPTSTPPSTTPPPIPTIVGEQIILARKLNKRHRPVGKPFVEVRLIFSTAMNAGTIANAGNYSVDWSITKKFRKQVRTFNHPVPIRSVMVDPTGTVVTLATTVPVQRFARGGLVTIVSPSSIVGTGGGVLGGTTSFTILPHARGITPA